MTKVTIFKGAIDKKFTKSRKKIVDNFLLI